MVDYRSSRRSRLAPRRNTYSNVQRIFLLSKAAKFAFIALIALILFIPLAILWISRDLPQPGKIALAKYNDATRIYDRKGILLYSVYKDENRTYTTIDQIPKLLQEATISIEDKDFYKNNGFSIWGTLRGTIGNVLLGRRAAGGSTITQQLVKNTLLSPERSPTRKLKELILSIQVSSKYKKSEILEMYLNNIPYGGTAIGVEAAAQSYFGKDAKDLDLAESAFLAGLPQSPSVYSPFTGNKYYIDRTDAVLRQMVQEKYITTAQKDSALNKIKSYKFSQRETAIKAPHFVMYVKQVLSDQFGENAVAAGGLQVYTTLDYDIQKEAEQIVKEEIDKLKGYHVSNGAAMITDPKTGEILAMVGSRDYYDTENDGNFNAAVQAKRQPGSSLKPIIYAKSFEKGYTPATLLVDAKTEFTTGDPNNTEPPYVPVNYNGKFEGPVQIRFALGNSLNIPAVKTLAFAGISDTMQLAYNMGIKEWEPTQKNLQNVGLSLVLGGRETTLYEEMTAYGVFANQGVRQDLQSIAKVTDSSGKVLYELKKKDGPRVLSKEIAFLISHILLDNNARSAEFGTHSYLYLPGKTVAVKTGTTDQKRDNWTYGYTPSYVVGVWVGNNDNSPMNQKIASGITGASPIWNRLMSLVLKGKKDEQFDKPDDVIAVPIDAFAGGLPYNNQPTRTEYFIKGTEPTQSSPVYQREFIVLRENDPVSQDGKNRFQEGIDAWVAQNKANDPRYQLPDDLKNPQQKEPTGTPTPTLPVQPETPTPTLTLTPTPTP